MGTRIVELSNSNCTMEFSSGGDTRILRARSNRLSHSFNVVATESQARSSSGFYPQQRATGPFTVTLELKGYREYQASMAFFEDYIRASLGTSSGLPLMSVSVPSRDFWRIGVPTGGVRFGDHVGSNVFAPMLEFESVTDPLDPRLATGFDPNLISLFDPNRPEGTSPDDASRFFYPASASTNDPNALGESLYDDPPVPPSRRLPGIGQPMLPE